jgi:alpha-tubulin suppressor-like RCC1 family protein
MALNFPDSPALNELYTDPTTGFTYQWNGEVWKSALLVAPDTVKELTDISSSFNGSTQTFPLTISGTAVTPVNAQQLIINLGGVIQNAGTDYTVSGSNITFTTAPTTGLTFTGLFVGSAISLNSVASNSVEPQDLTTGGPSWNSGGDVRISGVATISNTGSATTALYVAGGARITGILTVGSSSITIDGTNNTITGTGTTINTSGIVAVAITATSFSGDGTNLTGAGIGTQSNINTTGIITASAFYGDGINLVGAGVGTQSSINTSGIITASKFSGDATYITDVGAYLDGIVYSPTSGATGVVVGTAVTITFNKPIQVGVGTITLRTGSASGSIVESYDITSSNRLTISGAKLTIDPTSDLSEGTAYYVVVPAGSVKDLYNTGSNVVIDTYSFTTQAFSRPLFAWGYNASGSLGQNDRAHRSSPVQIPGTQWSSISSNYDSTYGTKTDGTLWAWGNGTYGRLGQNDEINRSSPVQIPGTQWSTFKLSQIGYAYDIMALKTDGTLWAWGYNASGQLGQNNTTQYSSPVQIPGTQWYMVTSRGIDSNHAIKTDGTLWAWGLNNYGRLGINDTVSRSSPIQVPGTQWRSVHDGYYLSSATKTDGTLWMWGGNSSGSLGQNNLTYYSSPRQVPGTQWSTEITAYYQVMAKKTDGTLWSWGYGNSGGLGQNDVTPRSSPIQLPGTQWNKVVVGTHQGCMATKTDGTLWAWGINQYGQLGQNIGAARSSPVQIPGTQWYFPDSGYFTNLAIQQIPQ